MHPTLAPRSDGSKRLACLPGTTHMSLTHQVDVLVAMLDRFLSAD
jgi:hypothetical protein